MCLITNLNKLSEWSDEELDYRLLRTKVKLTSLGMYYVYSEGGFNCSVKDGNKLSNVLYLPTLGCTDIIWRELKKWEHGEHAPGTLKVFRRSTQGKKLYKRCLDSVSGHI